MVNLKTLLLLSLPSNLKHNVSFNINAVLVVRQSFICYQFIINLLLTDVFSDYFT